MFDRVNSTLGFSSDGVVLTKSVFVGGRSWTLESMVVMKFGSEKLREEGKGKFPAGASQTRRPSFGLSASSVRLGLAIKKNVCAHVTDPERKNKGCGMLGPGQSGGRDPLKVYRPIG